MTKSDLIITVNQMLAERGIELESFGQDLADVLEEEFGCFEEEEYSEEESF